MQTLPVLATCNPSLPPIPTCEYSAVVAPPASPNSQLSRQWLTLAPPVQLSILPPGESYPVFGLFQHVEVVSQTAPPLSVSQVHLLVHAPCRRCRSPRSPCPRLSNRGSVRVDSVQYWDTVRETRAVLRQRDRLRPLPRVNASNKSC